MANLGSAAEGAFAISLSLYIIQNDFLPQNQHLELNLQNVKYWRRQVPFETFVNGVPWNRQLYNGRATLARQYGKTPVDDQIVTSKLSREIPVDYLNVDLSILLKAEEVRGYYGREYLETDIKLDGIISQMINDAGRYKTVIDSFKRKYLTNNTKELISVRINTIGREGEQSGGTIKGDVELEVVIRRYDPVTLQPKGAPVKNRFPKMYFSLKAAVTPPKTIGNEGALAALRTLSSSFGVDPISSPSLNVPITSIGDMARFITTGRRSRQEWEVDLYGSGVLTKVDNQKFLRTSARLIPADNLRIFDLLNESTYPELWRVRGKEDIFWKSYVIKRYVESVFSLIPSGQLPPNLANNVWNALFRSGFGIDPYASNTFLLSYGSRTFESSSLAYLKEVQRATGGQIFSVNNGNTVEFYIGNRRIPNAKLYHIRYKNRTVYDGNISQESAFDLQRLLKLELKLMPEVGRAFKERPGWTPGTQLTFNQNQGTLLFLQ